MMKYRVTSIIRSVLLIGLIFWVGQPLAQCLNAQNNKSPMRMFSSAIDARPDVSSGSVKTNVPLERILKYLQGKYNVQFFYKDDAIKNKYGPSPEALSKDKAGEALAQLLTSLNLGYTKIGASTYVLYPKDSQLRLKVSQDIQFTVSGKVTDASSGEALPGVNVLVKGTSAGTATDAKGHYRLDISSEADTLIFSYIGYQSKTIPVEGRHVINVKMSTKAVQGQQLVVVGYGEQKKEDITGSITTVSTDQLKQVPVADVGQALEGKVAGLNITQNRAMPGTSPSILVRGQNSISASNNPLIVVDGVPFSGSLNDINQSDIANISVLKGPSATAIYGTRGSNGVILITTKKGQEGKPQISYNGYVGTGGYAHKLTPASPQQYLTKWKWYQLESGVPQSQLTPVPNSPGGNEYVNYKAGKTVNWLKQISQPALSTDNNLKISGGTNSVTYFVSGEFMKQQGIIKGYNFERTNVRANIDANLTDYLDAGTNLFYNANNYDGGRAALLFAEEMSPYGTLKNSDGNYTIHPDAPELLYTNPFLPTLENRVSRYKRLEGNGYAVFKPGFIQGLGFLKGLQYKLNASYSYNPSRYADYQGRLAGSTQNGNASVSHTTDTNWLIQNILRYQKDFGKNHIDFTGSYEAQRTNYYETAFNAIGFINDKLSFNNLGAANTLGASGIHLFDFGHGALLNGSGSLGYQTSLLSQMARINYSYKNTYLLTLTARRDGYSAFGSNTSKYGFFPSAAVGWNISNESFMQKIRAINNLKLRFSYGKTGNEALAPYQTETTDGTNLYPFNGIAMVGAYPNILGNANLQWETSTTADLGVDFGIIKNRIRGTIDYYSTDSKGLLLQRQLPAITGYGSVWANLGETTNKGLEVTLNTTNIQAGGFIWTSDLTFSTNQNKIVDLYGDKKSDLGNRWFIGQPINVIYDYKMLGVWQKSEAAQAAKYNAKPGDLKIADLNGDGKITADDKTILGSPNPKWTGGLTNTFYYKNFNLRIFIQTVQGVMKYNPQLNWVDLAGRRNIPAALTYWTPDNNNNSMPALTYTNTIGYGYPRNASYTRLQDVTLTYNLPKTVAQRVGLGGLSVYLSGHDLITWTPWFGWSPEVDYTGRGGSNFTSNDYPQPRTIVLGVNITL